jgi:hypothetical protein
MPFDVWGGQGLLKIVESKICVMSNLFYSSSVDPERGREILRIVKRRWLKRPNPYR